MSEHEAVIREAILAAQQDSQLLDGRNYDEAKWEAALAALVSLTEERKQLEAQRDEWRTEAQKLARLEFIGDPACDARVRAAEARLVQAEECLACFHDEDSIEFVDRWGDTWNRCKTCGLLELWEGGTRFKVELPALRSLGDTPEKAEDIGGNRVARSKTERTEP